MTIPELKELNEQIPSMDCTALQCALRETVSQLTEILSAMETSSEAQKEMLRQFQEMKETCKTQKHEIDRLNRLVNRLSGQLCIEKNTIFGKKTEQADDVTHSVLSGAVPEDPVSDTQHADETEAPDPDASAPVQRKRKSRQKGKAAEKKAMLPVHTEYLADPDRYDKLYGAGNWRLFHWDVTETVEYQPEARYLKRVFTPVLSVGLEHTLARPDRVEKLLPHSLVSPSLLADALYRKFVLGVPVCRQVQDLLRHGVVIGKDVISDWIIRFAEDLFLPVCGRLRELLLADPHNHCDETVTQVIRDGRGPSSVCYVWVHTRSELSEDHPVTLFCCEKTRAADHLRSFYGDSYRGTITCDGYSAYETLAGESDGRITLSGCFDHCHRYFVNAERQLAGGKPGRKAFENTVEYKADRLIDAVYQAEMPLKRLTPEERYRRRQEEVAPKVDEFFNYIHSVDNDDPSYSDALQEAIRYAVNQEEKLRRFLTDPEIPMQNACAEREIRSTYCVGRNSWLFSYSMAGAETNAAVYSLARTCIRNDHDPYTYLKYLLEKMPAYVYYGKKSPSFPDDMLPWSDEYAVYEKSEKKRLLESCTDSMPVDPPELKRRSRIQRPQIPPDQRSGSVPDRIYA